MTGEPGNMRLKILTSMNTKYVTHGVATKFESSTDGSEKQYEGNIS
jgi:hypothetical protein